MVEVSRLRNELLFVTIMLLLKICPIWFLVNNTFNELTIYFPKMARQKFITETPECGLRSATVNFRGYKFRNPFALM